MKLWIWKSDQFWNDGIEQLSILFSRTVWGLTLDPPQDAHESQCGGLEHGRFHQQIGSDNPECLWTGDLLGGSGSGFTLPENQHDVGKSLFSIGNSSSDGGIFIVMLFFRGGKLRFFLPAVTKKQHLEGHCSIVWVDEVFRRISHLAILVRSQSSWF